MVRLLAPWWVGVSPLNRVLHDLVLLGALQFFLGIKAAFRGSVWLGTVGLLQSIAEMMCVAMRLFQLPVGSAKKRNHVLFSTCLPKGVLPRSTSLNTLLRDRPVCERAGHNIVSVADGERGGLVAPRSAIFIYQ